jgi:hypothetical protein
MSIDSLRPIEPMHMRKLLTSNTSLDEIRAALDTVDGEAKFDGTIKPDEKTYPLVHIKIILGCECG